MKSRINSPFLLTCLFLCLLISLNGCAIERGLLHKQEIKSRTGQVEGRYQKNKPRPLWLESTPEDDNEYHYLVGLSNEFVSEKSARKDALSDARINYAYYTGITVKDVNKMFSSVYTSGANVFDSSVVSLSKSAEFVNVDIHRVKAKHWYRETSSVKNGKSNLTSYKYWVLVQVPHEEYKRVQVWKKEQEAKQKQAEYEKKMKKNRAIFDSIRSAIASYKRDMQRTNELLAKGDPLQALLVANIAWEKLHSGKLHLSKLFTGDLLLQNSNAKNSMSDSLQVKKELERAQHESILKIASIRDSIFIETGKLINFNPMENTYLIARVWLKTANGKSPIPDFPLKMMDKSNRKVATVRTNKDGKAKFNISEMHDSDIDIEIDISASLASRYQKKMTDILAKVAVRHVLVKSSSTQYSAHFSSDCLIDCWIVYDKANNKPKKPEGVSRSNIIDVSLVSKQGNKTRYFEGDAISYSVNLSREAYVLMIYEDAAGNLIQFLPGENTNIQYDLPKANTMSKREFQIPPEMSSYEIRITAPFGKESIHVYSSEKPFPDLAGKQGGGGLFYLDRKSLNDVLSNYQQYIYENQFAYGEAKTIISTMPRMYSMN